MAQKELTLGEVFQWDLDKFPEVRFRQIVELFAVFISWEEDPRTIPVDHFHELKGVFRRSLRNQSTSVSWFKKYSDYIPRLFIQAKAKGWSTDQLLSPEWQHFVQHVDLKPCAASGKCPKRKVRDKRYLDLVRYFGRHHREPNDVRHDHLQAWVNDCVINDYRTYLSAREAAWTFEHLLLDQGYNDVNPTLAKRRKKFSIPLDKFPEETSLKQEVKQLLKFRMEPPENWSLDNNEDADSDEDDEEEEGDSSSVTGECEDVEIARRRQLRPYSASRLQDIICRLYGFTQYDPEHRIEIPTLKDLFTEAIFKRYKQFLIDERNVSTRGVLNIFMTLIAAARQYTFLGKRDWHKTFEESLDRETLDRERRRRRKRACLSLDQLETIPGKIDEQIQNIRQRKPSKLTEGFFAEDRIVFQVAWLEMQKFLMIWMLALAWPSRNLCECRVELPDSPEVRNPNVFFRTVKEEAIPKDFLTDSARQITANGGNVWQFSFSEEETSGCGPVHWALPDVLITPLKDYLNDHRGKLAKTKEQEKQMPPADTLFLNRQHRPLSLSTLGYLLIEITLKYTGKRISPQVLRDIWAIEYLNWHKDQFDDLALLLWHQNSERTKELYGTTPIRRNLR